METAVINQLSQFRDPAYIFGIGVAEGIAGGVTAAQSQLREDETLG